MDRFYAFQNGILNLYADPNGRAI